MILMTSFTVQCWWRQWW